MHDRRTFLPYSLAASALAATAATSQLQQRIGDTLARLGIMNYRNIFRHIQVNR